jgi:hypothetical protein
MLSILQILVLQIMDSHYQFSQRTRSNVAFPVLEVSYCALAHPGSPGKPLGGELLGLCPDLIQIFRIDHPVVLAASLVGWVQFSCFGIIEESTLPAHRVLFADVLKLICDDIPARKQASY